MLCIVMLSVVAPILNLVWRSFVERIDLDLRLLKRSVTDRRRIHFVHLLSVVRRQLIVAA
jgi:hypothetical protein